MVLLERGLAVLDAHPRLRREDQVAGAAVELLLIPRRGDPAVRDTTCATGRQDVASLLERRLSLVYDLPLSRRLELRRSFGDVLLRQARQRLMLGTGLVYRTLES